MLAHLIKREVYVNQEIHVINQLWQSSRVHTMIKREEEYSFMYLNKVDTAGCQQLFTTFRNWMEPRTVPTMNLVKLLKCVAFAAATLPCHDRNQDAREVVTQRCELLWQVPAVPHQQKGWKQKQTDISRGPPWLRWQWWQWRKARRTCWAA